MARTAVVLRILGKAFRRHVRSLGSFASNNFFLISLLIFGLQPQSGAFVWLVMALVLFLPLSSDPLRIIPPVRLALWPLENRERRLLRWLSPWLNPVAWILAALAIRGSMTLGGFAMLGALFAAGFAAPALPLRTPGRLALRLPELPGRLGVLLRKNLREMLGTLDFYLALLLAVSAAGARIAHLLPPDGYVPMTFLIVLALSSYAQCLFGLDGEGGMARYALLPIRGWQILAAKDAPFLLAAVVLTLGAAPLSGISAALMALAVGHQPSVKKPVGQQRWRFFSGASFANGITQACLMAAAAMTTATYPAAVAPCLLLCVASTWWYGRALERPAR